MGHHHDDLADHGAPPPSPTRFPLVSEVVRSSARVLGTLADLDDAVLREPSLLPGWTRGHVVAHLARNADAIAGVLRGPLLGEVGHMYPSRQVRDAAIEAGAGRSVAEQVADLLAAEGRLLEVATRLPPASYDDPGSAFPGTATWPVRRGAALRWAELEIHHADLGVGYGPHDWPAAFVTHLLERRAGELAEDGVRLRWRATDPAVDGGSAEGPEVAGPAADLAWWLVGRGDGAGLTCSDGQLPDLGKWR
jgi:maleylpyruvate isomerase